jgi:hypothetical protein
VKENKSHENKLEIELVEEGSIMFNKIKKMKL